MELSLSEEQLKDFGLAPGSNYVHTSTGPKPIAKDATADETSAANNMQLVNKNFNDMLFGDGGIYADDEFGVDTGVPGLLKRTIKGNYERWAKDDPRFAQYEDLSGGMIANIARGIGGEKGPLSDSDMLRVKGLLPSLSGVNVDTKATAQKKMKILQQLTDVKNTKGELSKADLNAIMKGSEFDINPPGNAPKEFTTKSGIKFTVE